MSEMLELISSQFRRPTDLLTRIRSVNCAILAVNFIRVWQWFRVLWRP